MMYEHIVAKLRKTYQDLDASFVGRHFAIQFNIWGEGHGALYMEIKDGRIFIEPYEYFDRDTLISTDADTLLGIAEGRIDPETYGDLYVEGDFYALELLKELTYKPSEADGEETDDEDEEEAITKGRAEGPVEAVKEKAEEAAEAVREKAGEAAEAVKERAEEAAEAVRERAEEAAEVVKGKAGKAAGNVKGKAGKAAGTVKGKAGKAAGTVKEKAGEAAGTVKEKAGEATEVVREKAEEAVETVKEKVEDVAGTVKEKAGSSRPRRKRKK